MSHSLRARETNHKTTEGAKIKKLSSNQLDNIITFNVVSQFGVYIHS